MRGLGLGLSVLALAFGLAGAAAAQGEIPAKRFVLSSDTDLPGGDLRTILDTTLEGCERACSAEAACTAFTFNSRNGSCFPKAAPGGASGYAGAISGRLITPDPAAVLRAPIRRGELAFLDARDIARAKEQAAGLGKEYVTGDVAVEVMLRTAREAEAQGNYARASAFVAAALSVTDTPEGWLDFARLLLAIPTSSDDDKRRNAAAAASAAINAYLRADRPSFRHSVLVTLADALEPVGRGRQALGALRLAQDIQPRDDTAVALERLTGLFGFRIEEQQVDSETARPRFCAVFTEQLVEKGFDYTPYVQLPETGLSVEPGEWRQLCVAGLRHGQRASLTFRAGLPAADGQTLAKDVTITAYIRDRSPGVRFPGRGYVLPKAASAALPVESVNTPTLALELYRVSDRNLIRSIQNSYFGAPMSDWEGGNFSREVGEKIWSGTAEVGVEINRDVTTRLPLGEALSGQPAGIYVLSARAPGKDDYDNPAAWQWFVVSDLGLTTMSGVDGLHVVVRGLGDAAAKAGAQVTLLSRGNREIATVTADAMGLATFPAALTRGTGGAEPALVVVTDGAEDTAFLSLTEAEFDLSDRGVEGREAAPPIDVFLATDRGAYRAGETVYATALARDGQAAAIEGLPLTARLRRPDGVEYSRQLIEDAGGGGHVFALPIAGSAPRGVWRIEVLADVDAPPLQATTFLVEDFLPERIDFALTAPEGALPLGGAAEVEIDARYLFGAPGADFAIEGEAILRAAEGLAAFPGYTFGKADATFNPVLEPLEGAPRTDDAGRASVTMALPRVAAPDRPLEARLRLRLSDGSGRPVEREVVRPVANSAPLIGIRPGFDGVVPEGAEAGFALIAVGPDGARAPLAVKWRLDRIETRYTWYQLYGSWNWEPVTTRARVAEGEADLGTADPAQVAAAVGWGEYELTVERADGVPGASSVRFHAGWYAPADATQTPDTLEMSLDKPAYRAGEVARLRVVPRAAGTALVSVLSNRLVTMQAVDLVAGENLIDLPVTEEWGAGVYVTVSALRPMDVAAGRLPTRALGVAHAAVDPGARALAAVVEVAAEAAPRGPLEVAVRVDGVAAGEAAWVTVAAVDVGILNLTGYKSPDPTGHYFGQRKLGVGIRDLYGRLIDGMNGAEGIVRSGGDAGNRGRLQAPPPTEELVAYFTGPVAVGADGVARVSFDLPSFNGTVRVMAVAWSKSAVGKAEAEVLVRDPVVVSASLPRFMAPGDVSRVLLEIVHAKGPAGVVGLEASARGATLGPVPASVDLAQGGKVVVSVPLTTAVTGVATIDVALTLPDGQRLTKTLTLPVQARDPEVAKVARIDLAPGQSFRFDTDVLAGFAPGTAKATLAIGQIARFDAPGLLASLDRYPYGCTEQLTSRALPLIYFEQVAQAMDLPGAEDLRTRIGEAVREVLLNQTSEGGFGLWSAEFSSDLWLDAYVTDFLSRARANGITVPATAFRAALDNLRSKVNYAGDFETGGGDLAYALMVLAREGAAAIGDLRYYADVKGDAFDTAIGAAQLGAALASYGDQARADAMFTRAARRIARGGERGQVFRADYGTALRDAAAVLALATEAGSVVVDRAALSDRIAARGGNRALSTQEASWILLATQALIDRPGAEGVTINGVAPEGPLVRVLGPGQDTVTEVRNAGAQSTILTVSTFGVPEVPEPAGGNGYAITRTYYTLDGVAVDPSAVAIGTRLVTVLEVTPFETGAARLMVTDPLPAGFEIDNPNLIRAGQIGALDWLTPEEEVRHSEFRQDRFLTALDRDGNAPFTLAYIVRAVSPGTFHHPAASVEDMYRPTFRAVGETGRITVTE